MGIGGRGRYVEKVTFYEEIGGTSLEQMVRHGKFDMRVKHFRNQYEIFCVIEGEYPLFLNNGEYVAHSGDPTLVDTSLIHMTKSITAEDAGCSRVVLHVSYDRVKALDGQYPSLQLVRFLYEHCGVYYLDKEQWALFLDFYRNLHIVMTGKAHNYKVGIDLETLAWLFKVTSYVPKQGGASPHSSDHPKYRIAYAIAGYPSENCEQNILLEELVAHFYLSKYYVYHTFKGVTGYTVTEYTDIHRIRKAKRLLEGTDIGISEAAHELGYESLACLERMFKSFMTISPLKYRKTLNMVTYTNEQATEFEEGTERLSSHRRP